MFRLGSAGHVTYSQFHCVPPGHATSAAIILCGSGVVAQLICIDSENAMLAAHHRHLLVPSPQPAVDRCLIVACPNLHVAPSAPSQRSRCRGIAAVQTLAEEAVATTRLPDSRRPRFPSMCTWPVAVRQCRTDSYFSLQPHGTDVDGRGLRQSLAVASARGVVCG